MALRNPIEQCVPGYPEYQSNKKARMPAVLHRGLSSDNDFLFGFNEEECKTWYWQLEEWWILNNRLKQEREWVSRPQECMMNEEVVTMTKRRKSLY